MTLKATAIPSDVKLLADAVDVVKAFADAATLRHCLVDLGPLDMEVDDLDDVRAILYRWSLPAPSHMLDPLERLEDLALAKAAVVLRAVEIRRGR